MTPDAISAHARQFRRHETQFRARIEVHPEHIGQFRLAFPDASSGLAVVDVSKGGLGIKSGFYFPRNLRVKLHVTGVESESGQAGRTLVVQAVVRRCSMLDHKPTYHTGFQFQNAGGEDERELVRQVMEARKAAEAVELVTTGGGGGSKLN